MASARTLEMAADVRNSAAGSALTGRQAKLYSQRLHRDMGQAGLASFVQGDVEKYLEEAMLLLDCALLERRHSPRGSWRNGAKRAAEILEWLSQPSLKPAGAPLRLLSAAAYQIADYPAMALGHLRHVPDDDSFSPLLKELLRANFPKVLEATRSYWSNYYRRDSDRANDNEGLTADTFKHIVMCIGVVCSYMRNGDADRLERSLFKLERLAGSLLYSRDPYSYLLACLCAAVCRRFAETSLWPQIEKLQEVSTAAARTALGQFGRAAFENRRVIIWPAQAAGVERLCRESSFVLCTPTGSGKTTVATLAIVQALFSEAPESPAEALGVALPASLVLYLVPSRALAAEVEARLAQDFRGITADRVVVTGLYGGIDWGPTDAWIQTEQPTVVVCTFEKAEALIRYLGVLFLHRVRLVVIDEAHMVEQDPGRLAGLADGSSRSFRLEQLCTRIFRAREIYQFRVLALSAVAARAAPALARWVGGDGTASPTTSSYRSTRQMLGRIEVSDAGRYTIRYDLMDGRSLRFEDEGPNDTPYVRRPFPDLPGGLNAEAGPEVRMRAPTLWAALQLAAERPDGSRPSVLISITQSVEAFAKSCVDLMDVWSRDPLPNYSGAAEGDDLWDRCISSALDYFGPDSFEHKLLRHKIVVHHGNMPALLARRLKLAIDRGLVRVVIATSTLTDGVNIPINYLLVPSLWRGTAPLPLQEFTNLIGRAGRPSIATEGSALAVLPDQRFEIIRTRYGRLMRVQRRQWEAYDGLTSGLEAATAAADRGAPEDRASSPLAKLLESLWEAWTELTGEDDPEAFDTWLEQTAVLELPDGAQDKAYGYLESLDAFLIAALEEIEELRGRELQDAELEEELTAIWRKTYAFAAASEERRLLESWLIRGRSLKDHYPDPAQRRRLYKTSLPPRSAAKLMELSEHARTLLLRGNSYAAWSPEERFSFIAGILGLLSQVPTFAIPSALSKARTAPEWSVLLRWWLAKGSLRRQPAADKVSAWFGFVSKYFIYRGAWGLGSLLGLLLDLGGADAIRALEIGDWPRSGLPWIAFWIKELINWGTLDPVAAFLLARGNAVDRPRAEAEAQGYYAGLPAGTEANDALDPRRIGEWVDSRQGRSERRPGSRSFVVRASLMRAASQYVEGRITVMALELEDGLTWIDPAGYIVARSVKPEEWPEQPSSMDFELHVRRGRIVGRARLS